MLFNSLAFAGFLPVSLLLFYLAPAQLSRHVLVVVSYIFYAGWDWRFLGLIIASTGVNYACGLGMARASSARARNGLLAFSVIFSLGLLGVFKYFNFFGESLTALASAVGWNVAPITLQVALPVGISFFTFQTMSYTIDLWRGKIEVERNFVAFAAFVAFFPQLVAGPIERASDLLPQMRERQLPNRTELKRAAWLIFWGYFLKVYMADNLAPVVTAVYDSVATASGYDIVLAHYAFAFQIFGDFAGYSYIAIGIALLFGVHLNENFRFPYLVASPSQFWRNWHISLSTWLRDYLYIALGGNRGTTAFVCRNLLLTMVLGGLWHGAAWNFVLWGLYQGVLLVGFRLWTDEQGAENLRGWNWGWRVLVFFQLTCFGWFLFRVPDMATFGAMLRRCHEQPFGNAAYSLHWTLLTLVWTLPAAIVVGLQFRRGEPHQNPFGPRVVPTFLLFMALLLLGNWGTRSFIYFQF